MNRLDPANNAEQGLSAAQLQALESTYLAKSSGRVGEPRLQPGAHSRSLFGRLLLHVGNLLIATVAFVGYLHWHLQGQSTPALAALAIAAVFGFAPLRALLHGLFALERNALHLAHGVGALGLAGLAAGGVISGRPVLNHAALAPFQIMGAAQAIMHQQRPRNARQAAALRRFAASLPEVQQFTTAGKLSSPENIARAVRVMSDLISKAQALGQTELEADPGFQSALSHAGLSLGLDSINQGIDRLSKQTGTTVQVVELRNRLARARQTLASH
jgi:hypothetical protein